MFAGGFICKIALVLSGSALTYGGPVGRALRQLRRALLEICTALLEICTALLEICTACYLRFAQRTGVELWDVEIVWLRHARKSSY